MGIFMLEVTLEHYRLLSSICHQVKALGCQPQMLTVLDACELILKKLTESFEVIKNFFKNFCKIKLKQFISISS